MPFVKGFKYWQANVTGSCVSIITDSSSLSKLVDCVNLLLALPISPAADNLTPSIVQESITESRNCERSGYIRANSTDGRRKGSRRSRVVTLKALPLCCVVSDLLTMS